MKASELITLLQDAIDKYGDLPISSDSDYYTGDEPSAWRIDNPCDPNEPPDELWLEQS